ncbi:MAG: pyrroline-5-carboxylate reductase [Halobacteriales archaeon]
MKTKVCVVGCGNLGGAVIRGLAGTSEYDVFGCDKDEDRLQEVAEHCTETTTDAASIVDEVDVVALAVKPDVVGAVLDGLSLDDQVVVSFAAAVPLGFLGRHTDARVVRVMPNLAAEYREMAAAVSPPGEVPDVAARMLDALGTYVEIDESEMDVATAVNGSGPAFVFYLIDAMTSAGVEGGLTESEAERLVVQTFRGAAEIVEGDERSIDELIDAVCSPGGTTIEGMEVLRGSTVAEDVGDAVAAAERRSEEISREVARQLDEGEG